MSSLELTGEVEKCSVSTIERGRSTLPLTEQNLFVNFYRNLASFQIVAITETVFFIGPWTQFFELTLQNDPNTSIADHMGKCVLTATGMTLKSNSHAVMGTGTERKVRCYFEPAASRDNKVETLLDLTKAGVTVCVEVEMRDSF